MRPPPVAKRRVFVLTTFRQGEVFGQDTYATREEAARKARSIELANPAVSCIVMERFVPIQQPVRSETWSEGQPIPPPPEERATRRRRRMVR